MRAIILSDNSFPYRFKFAGRQCDTHPMLAFNIILHNGEYWIEAVAGDGSRRFVERTDTLPQALRRLESLRGSAAIIERHILAAERARAKQKQRATITGER